MSLRPSLVTNAVACRKSGLIRTSVTVIATPASSGSRNSVRMNRSART